MDKKEPLPSERLQYEAPEISLFCVEKNRIILENLQAKEKYCKYSNPAIL